MLVFSTRPHFSVSVFRHSWAAFLSRACFWYRYPYRIISSLSSKGHLWDYHSTYVCIFFQQSHCSSSILLGIFSLISLRLVSEIYLLGSLSSQSAHVLRWYVFHISVAYIRSHLTLSSQPNFPVPFSFICCIPANIICYGSSVWLILTLISRSRYFRLVSDWIRCICFVD